MSWRDGLVLSLRSVIRRPARTSITIAAIALGTGLLVALASIAVIAETRVISQLGKGGPATAITVDASAPDPTQIDSDNPRLGPTKPINASTLTAVRKLGSVQSVTSVQQQQVFVIPPPQGSGLSGLTGGDPDRGLARPYNDSVIGVDFRQANNLPITVLAGRLPPAGSTSEVAVTLGYFDHVHMDPTKPAAVLGQVIEIGSPQAEPGGQQIRGQWTRAAIIGVVAQDLGSGGIVASNQLTAAERSWQLAGVDDSADGLSLPASQYLSLIVVADSLDSIHTVRSEITALGYATTAPEQLIASVQRYLHVVDMVLGAIGAIALLIAALGITNALLAAVRERRREIGVLKAIGAHDRDVLRWFLVEALICGVTGGLLGTAFGIATIAVVAHIVNDYLIAQGLLGVDLGGAPLATSLIGVAGASVLALIAAAWPALRAARLPAREAVGAL
ncbi:MAG TPA: ABC transporter permease [Candidatus Dormibacteraeota bacterium]